MPFEQLDRTDLHVDALYEGGPDKHVGADPLARLLPVGNQGGFRYAGSPRRGSIRLVVLFTTGYDPDWPDVLNNQTGQFTYWGDNKKPGQPLHQTKRSGNEILRDVFEKSSQGVSERAAVPPFLLFERSEGWNVRFRGVAAPGSATMSRDDELVAVWRSRHGQRFQNYRAIFTVLDIPTVSREWTEAILAGSPLDGAPVAWRRWVENRVYEPLAAARTTEIRTRDEQLPQDPAGVAMLAEIHDYFANDPYAFEVAAVQLWRMFAPGTGHCELTPRSRDGGVDAWGLYNLGPASDPVGVEFALEAKCYAPGSGVGVREMSRLISRLRHRQFGVFVTTSYFQRQTYQEIRGDGHPIVLLAGGDIIAALRRAGYGTRAAVREWLHGLPVRSG